MPAGDTWTLGPSGRVWAAGKSPRHCSQQEAANEWFSWLHTRNIQRLCIWPGYTQMFIIWTERVGEIFLLLCCCPAPSGQLQVGTGSHCDHQCTSHPRLQPGLDSHLSHISRLPGRAGAALRSPRLSLSGNDSYLEAACILVWACSLSVFHPGLSIAALLTLLCRECIHLFGSGGEILCVTSYLLCENAWE